MAKKENHHARVIKISERASEIKGGSSKNPPKTPRPDFEYKVPKPPKKDAE